MAGFTSTGSFPVNPLLPPSTTKSSSSLMPLSSTLFGLRLNISKPQSLISFSSAFPTSVITARYGGSRSYGGSRRSRQQSDSDDEQALDISSIRSSTVRLIDQQQNMVGVVPKSEAIQMAEDAELDLCPLVLKLGSGTAAVGAAAQLSSCIQEKVILSPDADPPVVRIMDYNKYRYELQKKKRGQQKKSAASRMDLKELKMGYNIDQHDYDVRLRAARKFLKDGDKVKIIVNLKGRENDFRNIAIELIRRFQNDVGELATEESKNFRDRNIFITLVPNKAVLSKTQDPPKKRDKSLINEVSAGV